MQQIVASAGELAAGRCRIVAPDGFLDHAVAENVYAGPAMARRAKPHSIADGTMPEAIASAIWNDYRKGGRSDRPEFLRPYLDRLEALPEQATVTRSLPPRQARHGTGGRGSRRAAEG